MRIITGQYKGRHFDIPRSFKARPTTDFAKENIFNVLQGYIDFEDTSALDLLLGYGQHFARTGITRLQPGSQRRGRPRSCQLHTPMFSEVRRRQGYSDSW